MSFSGPRGVLYVFACAMLLLLFRAAPALSLCGDIDGDGAVTRDDVAAVMRAMAGRGGLTDDQRAKADTVVSGGNEVPNGTLLSNDLFIITRASEGELVLGCDEGGIMITGAVKAPPGVSMGQPAGAASGGLENRKSVTVTVYRAGQVLQKARTNAGGVYTLTLSPGENTGGLRMEAGAGANLMRAFVTGANADITPATEFVFKTIIESGLPVSSFSAAELDGFLAAAGRDLTGAHLAASDTIAGIVSAFAASSEGAALAALISGADTDAEVAAETETETETVASRIVIAEDNDGTPFVKGEMVIRIAGGSATGIEQVLAETGGVLLSGNDVLGIYRISVPDAEGAYAALKTGNGVQATLNYVLSSTRYDPSDPPYQAGGDASLKWAFEKIKAPEVWNSFTAAGEPVVAVLDTGVSGTHPELAGRLVSGANMIYGDAAPEDIDNHGHGTQVAGLIAAAPDNGAGLAGVCFDCRIMPVKVCTDDGVCPLYSVLNGIVFAAENGADVVNISLSGDASGQSESIRDIFEAAVGFAAGRDALVVVSAGNTDSPAQDQVPASVPGVLAVGATDESDVATAFTNYGSEVAVCAPGQGIYTTGAPDIYVTVNGTSLSAAFVAGAAGMLRSADPALSVSELKTIIVQTADTVATGKQTGPRLNLRKAIEFAVPAPPDPGGAEPASGVTIEIYPAMVTLVPGQVQDFSAIVRSETGEVMDVPVSWMIDTEAATLLGEGSLQAFHLGEGTLTAETADGVKGTASVSVIVDDGSLAPAACAGGCTCCVTSTGWGAGSLKKCIEFANGANAGVHDVLCFDLGMASPITLATPGQLPPPTDNAGLTFDMTTDGRLYVMKDNGFLVCSSNNIIKGLAFNAVTSTTYGISLNPADAGCPGGATVNNNTISQNDFGTQTGDPGGLDPNTNSIYIAGGATGNTINQNFFVNNIAAAILINGGVNNVIKNNYFGANRAGTGAFIQPNTSSAIKITGASSGNVVGGDSGGGEGNLICGNGGAGVVLDGAAVTGNFVRGNKIGTNAAGTGAVANGGGGVQVLNGANANTIGGSTASGFGNLISGNTGDGVYITGTGAGNQVLGNIIGAETTGITALANTGWGVNITSAGGAPTGTIVGTTAAGNGNTIAYNPSGGVAVNGAGVTGHTIAGNSIFLNGGIAIDLLANGNNNMAAPSIVSYMNTGPGVFTVNGTAAANATVHVYQVTNSAAPVVAVDGSGAGELYKYLCTDVADGAGNFSAPNCNTSSGNFLSAVATDGAGNTSEAGTNLEIVNQPPVADAGAGQFKTQTGLLVTLDGSGSADPNFDPITYSWSQASGPEVVVLSDTTAVGPTFTPGTCGDYVLDLEVSDGFLTSAADSVTITVNCQPTANAGADQNPPLPGVLITLNGSASSDVDGDPLTYLWSQTGGAAVVLSNNTVVGPTFTPAACGNYDFELVVNDGSIDSAADAVAIVVNCQPVADAGPDQFIIQPTILITLDGSASSDANGDPLTYLWTQTAGAAVVLSNNTVVGPTFTPAVAGTYTFSLVVNDGIVDSVANTVTITVNTVPVANAGPDQAVPLPGALITLDGSGSADGDGDPLTYLWSQTGGAAVVLSNNTVVGPTFTPAACGSYDFALVVNDGNINSAADSVTVTVNCQPVADAGPDQFIIQPTILITLDGSASSDANGDPLTYAWTQTAGAAVVLSNNTVVGPTFTPAAAGTYTFSLVVNDGQADSAADTVTITVNTVPVANAGPDQFVIEPAILITLDGSASADGDGDLLTYLWTQTAGAAVVLSNNTVIGPTFTPAAPGTYTFSLVVNDGNINSAADSVTIIVNTVPVANAGADQNPPLPGALITLDGSASSDADGDPLTYLWSQTGGAAVVLSNNTVVGPTFTPAACGNYDFELVVNDGSIDSAADAVAIVVNCQPVADAGPNQFIIQPTILITLDGSASSDPNADPLTYLWTQTAGAAVALSNNTVVGPTFTPAVAGTYTFSLVVNDGLADSAADTVTITVNTVPVANAGPDQAVPLPGALITLDGSGSADGDGDPLTYLWSQTGGVAVVLSNNTVVGPTFTPAACGNFDFALVVNDGNINSAADSVTVTVNCQPVADAGPDQFIIQPTILITLDGSASTDANGDPLTYLWTQTAGAAVVLSNNTVVGPTFTPAAPGTYTFSLVVNDGQADSAADTVTITVNTVPVANAGPDQFVIQPAILITLDGSASADGDGDLLTYLWTQTAGAAVVLSDNTAVGPTFTPAAPGTYTFSLVVNDGSIDSAADSVTITVNTVPVANAGPNQVIPLPGTLVTLDGTASSDADGDPLTYLWTQTGGPATVLSDNTSANPTFTTAAGGSYTFQLVVNDGNIDSPFDVVVVGVNFQPVADAGPDQFEIQPGILITLDGSASSDANGDPLTYSWTQTAGAAVVLSNNTVVGPTFTPVTGGTYTFSLVVNDGIVDSVADSVTIVINTVPVANAGPDQVPPLPGALITLDGSGSADGDGDPITFLWSQTGGVAVVLSNNTVVGPTFTPAACGNYDFALVVNDGNIDSAADSVTVTVNCQPVADAGPDQFIIQPTILITLDGSASSDANGDPLTYLWTQTAGAAVVLSNNTVVGPTFTPAAAGTYTFSLVVNDGQADSAADTVTITVNTVPVANAGPDQFVIQPAILITLDGSASADGDGDPITYLWTQTAGAAVVLSDNTAVGPTFTPAAPGTYTFSLVVNDGSIDSAADSVTITVNTVPVANAGPNQVIPLPGTLVTLDGTASSDADGDPLTYLWTQTGGPATVLSDNTSANPTFTTAAGGSYTFQLVVNDGNIDSPFDVVVVGVNFQPVADAGPDQFEIQPGILITLDGSASSDANGDPLTYSWTQTAGAVVALSNNTVVGPTFTPVTGGTYTFSLVVNDGIVNSVADSVTIVINTVPVANAGPDQAVPLPGALITLDGSGSADGDGDPLTYLWSQTGGVAVVLSNNTVVGPTFTPAACGNYDFALVVNDGNIDSAADSVTIAVNCQPVADAGPDQGIIQPGILITLNGSASTDANGDPLTYAWTQTAGAAVVLSNNTVVGPTFTPAAPGTYTFILVVNDGQADSAADTVTITVNTVPVANAGPDQFVIEPAILITLDGSASADGDGDLLTYLWTQTAGAAVVLSDNTAVGLTFTPAAPGTYTFSLVVNDGSIDSAADSVTITVNTVPVANAGPNQVIPTPGVLVTLDGSASADADGDPITYLWTQTGGDAVVLSDNTLVNPTFTTAAGGSYTFELVVNDGNIDSVADVVVIGVNYPPVADAGPDQFVIQPGILITLDGSASSDANGDPLTYLWTQTAGAAVVLSNNTAVGPTFTPVSGGTFVFTLVVNDGLADSDADEVIIVVNTVPVADAGPDQLPPLPGAPITLDGSASADGDGDAITYAWSQTAGPEAVVLSDATAVGPTFTPALCGNFDFELVVNDGTIDSAADAVTIDINCVPIADAGPDQFLVAPGLMVTHDGSASSDADGDPLTYSWAQTAGPEVVVLSDATAVGPTFTPSVAGTYTFDLVVNDGTVDSAIDSVTITFNAVPVADAATDQVIIQPGILVTLDGSGSSDADGEPITYLWTLDSGPEAVVLSDATAVGPTFTPGTPGDYVFRLVVNDGNLDSAADTVTITVNTVPVADAGPDEFMTEPGLLVTLDGTGSSDADGDPLTYLWVQTSGLPVTLSSATSTNPTFTTPGGGNYTFDLVVNDGLIDSAADSVLIGVNFPPIADAGPDQFFIQPGLLVTLDGSASSDPEGVPITYLWTLVSGPAAVVLSDATAVGPTFTPAVGGLYIFQLEVNDGLTTSDPDIVEIRVNNIPVADAGPDQVSQTGWVTTLDGSGSFDGDGDPLTYAWLMTAGPGAITLSDSAATGPVFMASIPGFYTFQLIVNDGYIDSVLDTVEIEMKPGPSPPAALTVQAISQGRLDLAWTAPTTNTDGSPLTNLEGFNVYRSETPGGPYTFIAATSPAVFYDTDVKGYHTYYYVVQAVTSSVPPGLSPYSNEDWAVVVPVPYAYKTHCGNPMEPGSVVPTNTPGRFNRPSAIAMDGAGYLYIADTDNNRVQKFNTSCGYVSLWGGIGTTDGKFVRPTGIAYNETNGYVYVADSFSRVQYFTTSGNFVAKFAVTNPTSITAADSGDLFVTTTDGLVKQYTATGDFVAEFSVPGVSGIDFDASGSLLLGNAVNSVVDVYSTGGSLIITIGSLGTGPGEFRNPFGVAGDDTGNFYVADTVNNRIQVYDSEYEIINMIGSFGYGTGNVYNPKDMDADPDGIVYVIDQYNNRLEIFDPPPQ